MNNAVNYKEWCVLLIDFFLFLPWFFVVHFNDYVVRWSFSNNSIDEKSSKQNKFLVYLD